MKKLLTLMLSLALVFCMSLSFTACNKSKEIVVGATPSPHAEILNSKPVQDYVKSKGYTLTVKVYQDYVTPNKALNDSGLDANYFQHKPYMDKEVADKGYQISAVAYIHNEPLNLYGPANVEVVNKTVCIINDASNVERAYKLLVSLGIIDTYDMTDFDAQHPKYTSSKGNKVQCIDAGLLHNKVEEGGFAVIPGNYALTAWGASTAATYRVAGEAATVAYPNIIACRTSDIKSEKINILLEALSQPEVKAFIESTYGPTVNYCFEDLR